MVPGSSDVTFEWRGARITGDSLMIFPRGAELAATSNSTFHVFTCSFPESLLADVSETLGIATLDDLCKKNEVVRCDGKQITRLRHWLHRHCSELTAGNYLIGDRGIAESVTWELPKLLLQAAAASEHNSTLVSSVRRMQILKNAVDYIEQRADEAPTAREVCEAVQTSVRTLQYVFLERFGVSPKRYIRAIRLNKARKMLRLADSREQKVADVANHFGFWHMGQFAADYRQQFGELPATTLHERTG